MSLLKVLVPGPWWHELSYECDLPVAAGQRVLVPVGRSQRVGLCVGEDEYQAEVKVRKIVAIVDAEPVLPTSYIRAARITAGAFLCSPSEVLHNLLPSGFWRGEAFPPYHDELPLTTASTTDFHYRWDDEEQRLFYRDELLKDNDHAALVLFSERDQAVRFHKSLTGLIPKERLFLWPASGSSTTVKAWHAVIKAKHPVIIGGPGAASAPVLSGGLIIIDEESSPAWRTKSGPVFSLRSLAAARARESGCRLILGGRLPSSRVFSGFEPKEQGDRNAPGLLRLIDLNQASRLEFKGLKFPLPLSDVLVSETIRHVSENQIVFWLLDRRGVSSEIHCAECGQSVICDRCGSSLTLEKHVMRCPVCGHKQPVPSACPSCGGRVLQGASPGLELMLPIARNLLSDRTVCLWHTDDPAGKKEGKKRAAQLRMNGGLLLGSRRALSLLDELSPALIAWLDADAEARQPHYMSRFNAYSMLLESCCRGGRREVMLQSRRFSQPWIRGLRNGWRDFWTGELRERKVFGFPPYSHLVEIEVPASWQKCEQLAFELDEAGFFTMLPAAGERKLSVFTPQMASLRHFLEKYFTISRSRLGYPKIEVWSD